MIVYDTPTLPRLVCGGPHVGVEILPWPSLVEWRPEDLRQSRSSRRLTTVLHNRDPKLLRVRNCYVYV